MNDGAIILRKDIVTLRGSGYLMSCTAYKISRFSPVSGLWYTGSVIYASSFIHYLCDHFSGMFGILISLRKHHTTITGKDFLVWYVQPL